MTQMCIFHCIPKTAWVRTVEQLRLEQGILCDTLLSLYSLLCYSNITFRKHIHTCQLWPAEPLESVKNFGISRGVCVYMDFLHALKSHVSYVMEYMTINHK